MLFTEVKKLNKKAAARLAVISFVAAGMVVIALCVTVRWPKHTRFCAQCHNNVLFNNACKGSFSGNIDCIECHAHESRGSAVISVEIRDDYCMTELCHPLDKLSEKAVQYKKIAPFQHKTHLDKFTENFKLRCTSCHASLGGGRHFETDARTCNTCHFISAGKPLYTQDRKPVSDCALCHGRIEKIVEIYGKTFRHDAYEGNEKVSCSDCHFTTIQGSGAVAKEGCYQCHQTVADNFKSASDMHYHHIVRRKTACTPCHASITHGWVKTNDNVSENDGQQSGESDYKTQKAIMMGLGGVGIKGEPDPMYLATLNCTACHKDTSFAKVESKVCNNCHEKGFDKIMTEQGRFVASEMRLLKTLLRKARRQPNKDIAPAIQDAEANYNLIRKDGSIGAHNIKYIKDILNCSITNLKQIVE